MKILKRKNEKRIRRIKPTTGTICIFPGAFTHTHKGNLVLKGTKYIVTGWFYQQPV